ESRARAPRAATSCRARSICSRHARGVDEEHGKMRSRANRTSLREFLPPLWGKARMGGPALALAASLAIALFAAPTGAGAADAPKPHTLTVFAAASLTEACHAIRA